MPDIIKLFLKNRMRGPFISLSLIFLTFLNSTAQPNWISGPSITSQPISVKLDFRLNRASDVYYFIIPNNYDCQPASTIKNYAQRPLPYGSIIANGRITYSSGNYSTQIWGELNNLSPNTLYTIQIVAEDQAKAGVFSTVFCQTFYTLPCPDVNFMNNFLQPVKCVNNNAIATFQMSPETDPNVSGILKGTTWVIDWGDGTVYNYTSTADGDYPSLANRTHTYTSVNNCNYVFTCAVRNPCGKTFSPQYVAVVHGRDQQSDGDGRLRLVNNVNGSSTIQVCAGTETIITVRDNSIWNCQNPVVPGSLAAVPNLEPREIEWLYGRDPSGSIMNTITGNVYVTTMGNAPRASGRFSPVPYGPGSLAQSVTIPATCKAGEYFRIYLKNWNKCNWPDPEYIYTYIDILVIAAPPVPTVPGRTICFGDATTLTVTSTAVGTLTWYRDASLTNVAGTGSTYSPTISTPGTYNYWVTDQSLDGLMCRSQPRQVTLQVIQTVTNNSIGTQQSICYNTSPSTLTGSNPAGGTGSFTYQWQYSSNNLSWTDIDGANSKNYSPGNLTSTRYFRRVVLSGPCENYSSSVRITVYAQLNGGVIRTNQSICYNESPAIFNSTTSPSGGTSLTYSWQWSPAGQNNWTTISGASGLTYKDNTSLTASRDYRRVTTSGAGCGTAYSNTVTVTVYADINPGTIGSNQTICAGVTPATLTQITAPSGGPGTYTYRWQRSTNNVDFTDIPGAGASSSSYVPPALTETTYFRRNVTGGSCGTKSTNSIRITVNPLPTPTITGNTGPCLNYSEIYSTPLISGHTYSWSVTNGRIDGSSTQNTVKIIWDINDGPGTVSVTERISATTCTNTTTLNITVNPAAPGAAGPISGPANMCYAQTGVTYSISSVTNASNYVWSVPAGVTIVSGHGTNSIVVDFSSSAVSPVTISVYPENGCGAGGTSSRVITIYPELEGGSIGSDQTICYGADVAAFTSSGAATGGAGSFSYLWQYTTDMSAPLGSSAWQDISSATGLTYDHGTLTGTTRFVRRAVEGTCSTPVYSNIVTVTVRPQLNGGSIGSDQTICYGTDVAAFTSSGAATGGAGSFSYLWQYTTDMSAPLGSSAWQDISSATGLTYDHGTLTGTTRFVRRAVEGTCSTPVYSNIVRVTVRPELKGGSISGNQTICYGTIPAQFTNSTAASGGAGSFTYSWWYTTDAGLDAGDPGWNEISSSNTTGFNYNNTLTTTTRFVRRAVDGTCTTPVYSNIVTVTVRPQLDGGEVGSSQDICNGDDVPPFTSITSATGGAGAFTYTWQYTTNMMATPGDGNWTDIDNSNDAEYDHGILTTTTKFVRRAVESTCSPVVYSNEIVITVMPALNSGAIGSSHFICYGEAPLPFSSLASANGGGGSFTYTWQYTTNTSAIEGDGNWTDIDDSDYAEYSHGILTETTLFVRKAEDASCTTPVYSNIVTVTINPLPLTSEIRGPSVLCEDAVNRVYEVDSHPGSTYAWTVPPSLVITSPSGMNFIIVEAVAGMADPGDKITVTETIVSTGCVGEPVELPVSVVPIIPGEVVSGPASLCLGDTAVYSVPFNSGSTYTWSYPAGAYIISDQNSHSVEITFNMAVTGDVSVIENSNGVCNTVHFPVSVTVNPLPAIFNLSAPVAYCSHETGVTITLSGSQAGVNYQLYNSLGPVNAPLAGTGSSLAWPDNENESYYVIATNATTGCKQLMNGTVTPVVNFVDGGQIDVDQAVCENSTPAAFTSTTAGTGNGAITYQWQRSTDNSTWIDIPGATSLVYASGPLSENTYFRRMTISTMGSSVCEDPSDPVLVTVIIFHPGSIGSDISICEGTAPATAFTSVPPSGTGDFGYRWMSSTDAVNYSFTGITDETFTPGILYADTWFKREVTATYLSRSCTRETGSVKVTVINFSPGSIGSAQTICEGTSPAPFTSVAASGDGSFTYSWESSSTGTGGWVSLGVTTPTYSSPALSEDTYFRRAVTATHDGTSCTLYTNTILVKVNSFDPGTIGPPQTICENTAPAELITDIPASADPGATMTYQWQNSSDGTNFSSISGATGENYTSGALLVNTSFRRQVTVTLDGRTCMGFSPPLLITVNNFDPGSIEGSQTICEGDTPLPITSFTAGTGDGIISYQWQESSDDGVTWDNVPLDGNDPDYSPPALFADMHYKRIATSDLYGSICTKESNTVKITVINFDPGSIAGDQSICENSPAAPLTSVSPSGDGIFTYRWQISTNGTDFTPIGATGETYNPGILTQDTWYRRDVTSTLNGKTCVRSTNVVTITVLNFHPGSITGDQSICEGDMPVAFGSTPASGDGNLSYEWLISTNGITYTPVPSSDVEIYTPPTGLDVDTWFKRTVTSSDGIASCVLETGSVKVTVINFSPGSIASDQTICEGTAPAPFTSVAASGDGSFTYSWESSPDGTNNWTALGITTPGYSSPELSADTYFRRAVTAQHGGTYCTEYTDIIFVKVIRFDPGEIGTNQTVCEGEIPDPLTETTAASGDGTFTYLWQSSHNGTDFNNITGATAADYAPGPLTQNTWFRREVTATLGGRACRLYTDPVIVRVNRITPGTITGIQTICEGAVPAQLTGTEATSVFPPFIYQWQESTDEGMNWSNVTDDGIYRDYSPPALNADTWYKRLVISTVGMKTCMEESNVVRVTVINFDPGTIEEDQVICENTSAALITSITPTGDGVFSYRWFSRTEGNTFTQIGGALSETYNPGILTEDTWYYREVRAALNGRECFKDNDVVRITVNNLTPGSIYGDQYICEGEDPVPFTSVGPVADGNVSYQWQSSTDQINFTDIGGATDETYDPPVLDQDTWFRRAVTSTIGLNACTKYTSPVRVTVINFVPGSIGSSQTICAGTAPAAFTSVAASGDGSKSYQWQISTDSINYINVSSGGNGATYSAGALTQDTWFRRLTTATDDYRSCVKVSDTVKVTVISLDPGTISSSQEICENGTPDPFTSTDATGRGVISYQWQASLDGTHFTNITGAIANDYAHGAMTTDTWFRRQVTATLNGTQCVAYTDPVLVFVNNMTPGSISGTQTICEDVIPAPFTSVSATGDGTISYQWQESADNGGSWNDVPSGGNVEIYVAPALDADMWYKRIAKSMTGLIECSRESNVIMVTVNNFEPGNIAADQTICENTAAAPFTSITPTGDGVFSYRWFRSTDGLTFALIPTAVSETYSPGVLSQDTWYYREVTSTLGSNKCIARTDTLLIRVNNFDPGDITGTQIICEGTAPAEFTETAAAVSYDGALISYQWQESSDGVFFTDIPSADGVTYSAPSPEADTWYRRMVKATLGVSECIGYSSIIKVTVINFVPGSIGSDQTICEGSSPATFTSVPATGDGAKSYQWQFSTDSLNYTDVPAGGTTAGYSAGALTQDTWFRRLSTATFGSVSCTKITDTIKITVINFDPGSISANQFICEGETPQEIISPPAAGDGTFAYQWQSSTNNVSFSNISGATGENYEPGALTVDTWFRRQVTATLNYMSCTAFTPVVRITVNNLIPGSITGDRTICTGETPPVITSLTAGSGDGSISYQWQESADDGLTWDNVPADGDGPDYLPQALFADMLYKRIAISDLPGGNICIKESNTVKITVINFDPGEIGDDQTICEGTAPDALTSTVSPSGDGSFTYQWFRSTDNSDYQPVPGALNETYSPGILTQDTWYYREVTASLGATSCVANTNKVLVIVNNFLPGSLDADQTICEGGKPALIGGVSPSGDGMNYTYQWHESVDGMVFTGIPGATDETYDPPVLNADTWYKRAVTSHLNSNECTRETAPVRIWVINFVPGTVGEDQTICENTAPAPFSGTAPSGDGNFTYSWESSPDGSNWDTVDPAGNAASYAAPALTADTWYRRVVTAELNGETCSKATLPVRVIVINFDPGTISADQTICEGDIPVPFGSSPATGDGNFTYQWQSSINGAHFSNIIGETNETYEAGLLMADTWYRRQVTAELNGRTCSAVTTEIMVTVNNVTAGSIGSDQIICEGTAPDPLTSVTPVYDGDVSYEWQSSSDGTTFSTIFGAEDETYSPPELYADTWYKRIAASTLDGVICKKESAIVRITVNNFDPGSISGNQIICEGTAPAPILSITPAGDGTFSYRWFRSNNGTDFDLIIGAMSETYNPGILTEDTWYMREVTSRLGSNICVAENAPVEITVNNLDPGVVTGDVTICEGEIPSVITGTDASGDGNIIYQWRISTDGVNYTDITTDGDGKDYAPGPLFQDTWFLRTVTSDHYGQLCTEISGSFRVTVNDVDPGTIISDQTICLGGDPVPFISIVHGSGKGSITYVWESSTNETDWDPIAASNAPNYDSPALTQDTWFRRVTRSDHYGTVCEKISNKVKVTVNEVYGGEIEKDQSICFGSAPAPLTSADDGGGTGTVSYQWQRSADGVIWNTISGETGPDYSPGVLYSDTWYKRVLISIENGVFCQAESDPVKITVNSLPVAVLTGGETICEGDPATLTINITSGTAPYQVEIENHGTETINGTDASILVYPSVTTTYTILSVTDANGCVAVNKIGSATVHVRDLPAIVTDPVDMEICEYGVLNFSVVATGSDLVYQWYVDRQDGNDFVNVTDAGIYYGAQTPVLNLFGVTRDMDGYQFRVTVSTCGVTEQSDDVLLRVNTVPEIVKQPRDTTICSGDDALFAISGRGTDLVFRWQVNTGSGGFTDITDGGVYSGANDSILHLTNVPLSFNNYFFRVIISGTCGSPLYSNFVSLRVNGPPVPVLHPQDKAVCDGGGPVFFVGNGAGLIDSLRWQVSTDNGGTWDDIYDNANYAGTTTQQLSVIDISYDEFHNNQYRLALKAFCETAYTSPAVLTVNRLPVVTFADDPVQACGDIPLVITPEINQGTAPWKSHSWSGDIGPLNNYFSATPTFRTRIAGTYNLTYRVVDDNMCAGEGSVSVVVDAPDATFTQDVSMACTPATVKFSKDMTGMNSWVWNFGDGSPVNTTDENPEHVFTNTTSTAIIYRTVTLTVESMAGCTDTKTSMVTVYPAVIANLTASDDSVCHGNQLTFTADPGANIYMWDYGDGTPRVPGINTSTHMFTNPTGTPVTRTVKVVTTSMYGCSDSTTVDIVVMPMPLAQFSATPNNQTFSAAGNKVSFTDETTPASSWTYHWDFDDGSSSVLQNPEHTFSGIGTYNVVLTVSNGKCTSTISHPVHILPIPPVADFDSIPSGCATWTITPKNTSLNTEMPGTTYRWDFGDGSYSTAKNPSYTYFTAGEYRVELTVTGPGGVSMKSQVVRAYPSPRAYFEVSPMLVFVNDEKVRCFNLTEGGDYFVWEFGDGDTSRMREPYHKYMEEGVYDITLWAYSNNGCRDVFVLSPGVTVQPAGDVRFSSVFRPNPTGPIERTDLPTGGNEVDQFFFPPIRDKVIKYKLQVFNRLGVLLFESRDINVPWNGYYKGQLCPQGVYVWYVEGKYANGQPFKKVGDITLLH